MISTRVDDENRLPDDLAAAYQARNRQLREAHIALAEAVSALCADLKERRSEVHALREEVSSLREHLESLGQRHAHLEYELEVARNMRVVRWSAPLRRAALRWRDPRR